MGVYARKDEVPFVQGKSVGEAYVNSLALLIKGNVPYPYLMVHVSQPVLDTSIEDLPQSLNVDDWVQIINLGKVYEVFSRYDFLKDCRRGGSRGKNWIDDRVCELLHPKGDYFKRLEEFGQLRMITDRLRVGMHGGSTNALVCQIFNPEKDLVNACKHRPRAKRLACLTQLDFKPVKAKGKKRLNLFSVFRSQFFDTKAYGNFISLAMLLCKVCEETGYEPGTLTSTANNVTFDVKKRKKDRMEFYDFLSQGSSNVPV